MIAQATTRGDRTRSQILETAINLFKERGYENTTMRLIADKAEVSLGNAYYYFKSKEHLIHLLYLRMQQEQLMAWNQVLEREEHLKERLYGVLMAEITLLEPYHELCVSLFKNAADPNSPLNPFSEESRPIVLRAVEFYKTLIDGAKENVPADLLEELPFLFWLYQMGINLYWIHDNSLGRIRTQALVKRSVDLTISLIKLLSLPVMTPARKRLIRLIKELTEEFKLNAGSD